MRLAAAGAAAFDGDLHLVDRAEAKWANGP